MTVREVPYTSRKLVDVSTTSQLHTTEYAGARKRGGERSIPVYIGGVGSQLVFARIQAGAGGGGVELEGHGRRCLSSRPRVRMQAGAGGGGMEIEDHGRRCLSSRPCMRMQAGAGGGGMEIEDHGRRCLSSRPGVGMQAGAGAGGMELEGHGRRCLSSRPGVRMQAGAGAGGMEIEGHGRRCLSSRPGVRMQAGAGAGGMEIEGHGRPGVRMQAGAGAGGMELEGHGRRCLSSRPRVRMQAGAGVAGMELEGHGRRCLSSRPRVRMAPPPFLLAPVSPQRFLWLLLLFLLCCAQATAYDPLDPNGNITVAWDFVDINKDTYSVSVSLHNYQLYRHLEDPGWRLSWFWAGDEVIYDARGAEATEQGNCSRHVGAHSCVKQPVMVDLPPGTPFNQQVANCCRGGVLSSSTQNSKTATSAFLMNVGDYAPSSDGGPEMPFNFSLGVPGYTCSNATVVPPSRTRIGKQRHEQALMTWQVTCFYSQTVAGPLKSCCVSLSTFYSSTIVDCPSCICGACPATSMAPQCNTPEAEPAVRCTGHMCPIRVHWHVKTSYRQYWRVKMTVVNFNTLQNYSDWNIVVQHPSMQNLTQVYSFNHQPLIQYGTINDTELFWGLPNFNEMLLQDGNVQTEILLRKEDNFTFAGGWAFPRKVYFDGHECAMPGPDVYPQLPSGSCHQGLSAVDSFLIAVAGFIALLLLF